MNTNPVSEVETLIRDFLEQRQRSIDHHKKKTDAEKEYNKLLALSGGEEKNFTLEQAEKIFKAHREMTLNEEYLREAEARFNEAYEKLKELGRILFHANITAEMDLPTLNGHATGTRQVTVTFPNGEVNVI